MAAKNTIEVILSLLMPNFSSGMKEAAKSTESFGESVKDVDKHVLKSGEHWVFWNGKWQVASSNVDNFGNKLKDQKTTINDFNKKLREQATASSEVSYSLNSLVSSIRSVIAAYASYQFIKKLSTDFIETASASESLKIRLESLTSGSMSLAETQKYLSDTSARLGVDYATFANGYASLLQLQQSGLTTTDNARKILEGLSNMQKRTGATSEQLKQSLFGLSQGMSSGTLKAEELNQITEPLPGLMQAFDKANNGVAGSFRRLTNEGKVSSSLLEQTLIKALEPYQNYAEKTSNTISSTYTRLSNSYNEFKASLSEPVNSALVPTMNALNSSASALTEYVRKNEESFIGAGKSIASFLVGVLDVISAVTKFISENSTLVTSIGLLSVAVPILYRGLMLISSILVSLTATTGIFSAALTTLSANPIMVGLAVFSGVVIGLSVAWDSLNKSVSANNEKTKEYVNTMNLLSKSIDSVGEFGNLGSQVSSEILKIKDAYKNGLIDSKEVEKQINNVVKIARDAKEKQQGVESDISKKRMEIIEKTKQFEIETVDKVSKEKKKSLDSQERDLENHYKKLEKLEEEFAKLQEDNESSLRELKRKGMTDTVAQGDRLLEYFEKLKASREAANSGDFKLSADLAKDAQKLSKELGNVQSILNSLEKNTNSNEKAVLEQTRQSLNRQIQDAMNKGDYKAIEELNKKAQDLTKNLSTESSAGQKELADKIRQMWLEESKVFGSELSDKTNQYKSNLDIQIALTKQANIATENVKAKQIEQEKEVGKTIEESINISKKEIDELEKKLDALGKKRKTVIEADIEKAKSELLVLEKKLNDLKNTKINVTATTSVSAETRSTGGIIGYNTGGIAGYDSGGILPGYGGGDRRLAMLEDGEGVLNKQSTSRFKDLFLMMNYKPEQFAQIISPLVNGIQGFNVGGIVNNIASQVPSFSPSAAGATNSGGNPITFRLELASGEENNSVTLMGEQKEIAKLNKMLRRFSR